ncbi:hypothetical protein M2139_001500 [Enterococcus sp. PF1-24]|uniref:TrbC/VirB2 family protein n=1 Tax=unclassified Enterococcus TaxID=2608891 RepID=UPI0024731A33|nr:MULTISPECIES: TrbC/VirB2 family protein [unclassified Enterococcus]MDH6364509.1 hypothetical protein [Enterococcus sp. PFB1-1]MDH6401614.1 hypothetical protein [Enterococcus sp. PF1-24]
MNILTLLQCVNRTMLAVTIGNGLNEKITEFGNFLKTIAKPSLFVCVILVGFMFFSGNKGAEKGKSWLFWLLIGACLIFGGATVADMIEQTTTF